MMKWILLLVFPLTVSAADIKNEWTPSWQDPKDGFDVSRKPLGAGSPVRGEVTGFDRATPVADGLFHVPGSMPGFPTATTLWPRVVQVECVKNSLGKPDCTGYDVNLAQGRGEYVFIQPHVKEEVKTLNSVIAIADPPHSESKIKKHKIKKKVASSIVCQK